MALRGHWKSGETAESHLQALLLLKHSPPSFLFFIYKTIPKSLLEDWVLMLRMEDGKKEGRKKRKRRKEGMREGGKEERKRREGGRKRRGNEKGKG